MNNRKESFSPKEVIEISCNSTKNFLKLNSFEKNKLKSYIEVNRIDCTFYGNRGFDILKQCFFVTEYYCKEPLYEFEENTINFSLFYEFYDYLKGDIFENSCYFGYKFTKEDRAKIELKNKKINMVSFSKDNIDNYTFEISKLSPSELGIYREKGKRALNKISENKKNMREGHKERNERILNWINSQPLITSGIELDEQYRLFKNKFLSDRDIVYFYYTIKKDVTKIENAVIEYVSSKSKYHSLPLEVVLMLLGPEVAQKSLDEYCAKLSYSEYRNYKYRYSTIIKTYRKKAGTLYSDGIFNSSKNSFIVNQSYFYEENCLFKIRWIFLSFEDAASWLNYDLSNCDLTNLDYSEIDLAKYKINGQTKLPSPPNYTKYEIRKGFENGKFYVHQYWYGNDKNIITCLKHSFKFFCDFFYFLHGDLSYSDLIMCDGTENIKSLKNANCEGIKIRSSAAQGLGILPNNSSLNALSPISFPAIQKNEDETVSSLQEMHVIPGNIYEEVAYVSDIHLLHRFEVNHCYTEEDRSYVFRKILGNINNQLSYINFIAGDISSDFLTYQNFINSLSRILSDKILFVTLGNHELWPFSGEPLDKIIKTYKAVLNQKKIFLVHNNLYIFKFDEIKEISESKLRNISSSELREETQDASLIVFGGIGFSGKNSEFNANNGVYCDTINRQQEIFLSHEFYLLYEKISRVLPDKNVVILTHMPFQDWSEENNRIKGYVYISGHNHRNYYFDDGNTRIFSDNQIGYKQKEVWLKHFYINRNYNYFSDYKDGIYSISKRDYELFYDGIGEVLNFNREYLKLLMLKNGSSYMFLMTTLKGKLLILNGGMIKKAEHNSIDYYWKNLSNYSNSIKQFLSKYKDFQESISKEVKKFGGEGYIHGCIIDIDYYNHLYVNPLDGSVVPYFAYSKVDKYVYKDLPTLLADKCLNFYKNYLKLIASNYKGTLIKTENNNSDAPRFTYVTDTSMYNVSRIIRGLQFTLEYNVVKIWNDSLLSSCSAENGRALISSILHSNEIDANTNISSLKKQQTTLIEEEQDFDMDELEKEFDSLD